MKTIFKATILSILALALAACGALAPAPTPTATATETRLPTSTTTITPEPTATPTETPVPPSETPSEPVLPLPSGEPLDEWEGVPVMPGAIAGSGDSQGYTFTIDASPDDIQAFYEAELSRLGWDLLASGQGSSEAVILIFIQGEGTLSVSILPQEDGTMYVLLVK